MAKNENAGKKISIEEIYEKIRKILANSTKGDADARIVLADLLTQANELYPEEFPGFDESFYDEIVETYKELNDDPDQIIGQDVAIVDGKIALEKVGSMDKATKLELIEAPTIQEARYLVDLYYGYQANRIALGNQITAIEKGTDPQVDMPENMPEVVKHVPKFLKYQYDQMVVLEKNVAKGLSALQNTNYLSEWASKNLGIGPVISVMLRAMLELQPDMHAGSWWQYAGLNTNNRPRLYREQAEKMFKEALEENGGILDDELVIKLSEKTKWSLAFYEAKGKTKSGKWSKEDLIKYSTMIPYNKKLKVLMWKIGASFHKVMNNPNSLYGRLYKERLEYETIKNERGDYADQAAAGAARVGKTTIAYSYYEKGKLPPAHLNQRAERWVTKIFIAHLFEAEWYNITGEKAPEPYILNRPNPNDPNSPIHSDYIEPEVPYDSVVRDCDR